MVAFCMHLAEVIFVQEVVAADESLLVFGQSDLVRPGTLP
jgi:hypothetical protein